MSSIKINGNRKVWFTSDTHAFHKNITRGTTQWSNENEGKDLRDFDTPEEMTQAIADGINKYVGKDDVLIHLGDFSFSGIDNIYHFRQMLNVHEIHLVRGNHDQHVEVRKAFSHDLYLELGHYLNTFDMFDSISDTLTVQIDKQKIFCSHYAHRVWDHHQHGRWHLYGHSHSSLEHTPYGKSLDVGVDNAFRLYGEYRPFSISDIQSIMDAREVVNPDHHNSKTT